MTTWVEVVDTSVKIGLGVLIGGLISLIVQRRTHAHEEKIELLRRRRDSMDEICKDFEAVHATTVEYASHAEHILNSKPFGTDILRNILEPGGSRSERSKGLTTLQHLEGRLSLLGYPSIAQMIQEYRMDIARMGKATDTKDWNAAVKSVSDIQAQLEQRRVQIYVKFNTVFEGKR